MFLKTKIFSLFFGLLISVFSFAQQQNQIIDIVVFKFVNEKKIKTYWDLETNLTSWLVEKFLLTGKYNVIVPLPQELNEINKKIITKFGKDYIKYITGDYLIEVGKYYNSKVVVYPEIKKFSIRNVSILNPKLGGQNIYFVDVEFHINVVDPQYITATHFSVSSETVGKTESEFRTLLTDGGGWYDEMLTYKEFKQLPKMKFGSYEFRTSKLGQKLNSMLNEIVLNVDKFVTNIVEHEQEQQKNKF